VQRVIVSIQDVIPGTHVVLIGVPDDAIPRLIDACSSDNTVEFVQMITIWSLRSYLRYQYTTNCTVYCLMTGDMVQSSARRRVIRQHNCGKVALQCQNKLIVCVSMTRSMLY
jgi:hypothetical protein